MAGVCVDKSEAGQALTQLLALWGASIPQPEGLDRSTNLHWLY